MKKQASFKKSINHLQNLQHEDYILLMATSERQNSFFVEEYNLFFQNTIIPDIINLRTQILNQNGIFYNQKLNKSQFSIAIKSQSEGLNAISLAVSLSHFVFNIDLFNLAQQSECDKYLNCIGSGAFGSIYLCDFYEFDKFVLKSISIFSSKIKEQTNQMAFQKTLRKAIAQYCMYKICSVLQIGPHLSKTLGFDLIIFNDSIQFTMEVCQKKLSNQMEELKLSLGIMHSLNIIHGDIKQQNIMWSPKYQKYVFVDFGLSKHVMEPKGYRTLTHFFGTYTYCSPEMSKIMNSGEKGYVDLFYNDVYGLKKVFLICLNRLYQNQLQIHKKPKKLQKYQFVNFLKNIKLSWLIFHRKLKEIQSFILQNKSLLIQYSTYRLLKSMKITLKLDQLWHQLINKKTFLSVQQFQLKQYLRNSLILPPQIDYYNKTIFQKRIKQLCQQGKSINSLMILLLISSGEDATPFAERRKKQLKLMLSTNSSINEVQYWQNFIQFSMNLYVSTPQLLQMFELVKEKLLMEQWESVSIPELKMFSRATELARLVFEKFHINLFELFQQAFRKQRQYNSQTAELLEKFQSQFPYLDIYNQRIKAQTQLQNEQFQQPSQQKLNPIQGNVLRKLIPKLMQHHKQIALPSSMKMILTYAKILEFESKTFCSSDYENFLQQVYEFEPIKKSYLFFYICKHDTFRQKRRLSTQNHIGVVKNLYKNATNFCFSLLDACYIRLYEKVVFRMHCKQLYTCEAQQKGFKQFMKIKSIIPGYQKLITSILNSLIQYCEITMPFLAKKYLKQLCHLLLSEVRQIIQELNYSISSQMALALNNFLGVVSYFQQLIPLNKLFMEKAMNCMVESSKTLGKTFRNQIIFNRSCNFKLFKIITLQQHYLNLKQLLQTPLMPISSTNMQHYSQTIRTAVMIQEDCYQYVRKLQSYIAHRIDLLSYNAIQIQKFFNLGLYWSQRGDKGFSEYFNFFLFFLQITFLKEKDIHDKFSLYVSTRYLIQKYVKYSIMQFQKVKSLFYSKLGIMTGRNPELFRNKYANAIIIVEIILTRNFSNQQQFNLDLCDGLLKLANFWIQYSSFLIRRNFLLCIKVWTAFLLSEEVIQFDSLRKQRCVYIRAIRNSQYIFSVNLNKYIGKSFNNKSQNKLKCEIRNMIENKISFIMKNKFAWVNILGNSNLGPIIDYYSNFLNKEAPHQQIRQFAANSLYAGIRQKQLAKKPLLSEIQSI